MKTQEDTRPTLILAAIDESPASAHALATATSLARLGQVELHLVHAVGPGVGPREGAIVPDPTRQERLKRGYDFLVGTKNRFPELPITVHNVMGGAVAEILRLAKELDVDVVVVGSHNRGAIERWFLGSVSEQIVRGAGCAVIVARPKDHGIESSPRIEPPCPDCTAIQKTTSGETAWCARHAERHAHGRVHYENPAPFAVGSTFLRPEG